MKKQAWTHVVLQNFFYFLEDHFPKIAHGFLFFSKPITESSSTLAVKAVYDIKIFNQKYQKTLDLISNLRSSSHIKKSNRKIIVYNFLDTDFFIVANNKFAIASHSNLVINYFDDQRIKWGNAFPSFYTISVKIDGHLIYVPQIENYYHVVVDHLLPAILYVIKNLDKIKIVTFVTRSNLEILKIFCKLLRKKGVRAEIHLIKNFEKIYGNCLISGKSTSPDLTITFAYKEIFDFFAAEIDDLVGDIDVPDFVLVSRHKNKRRNLLNEPEIYETLESRGFKKLAFNSQNILTQIAVFRKSKIIISVHGAALTNIMWAKNCRIIAISPKNMLNFHYLHIASQYNLDYTLLQGDDSGSNDDFVVDKHVIADEVDSLISFRVN